MLVYLHEINPHVLEVECIPPHSVMNSVYVDWEKDMHVKLFGLSYGEHTVHYQGKMFYVTIRALVNNENFFHSYNSQVPEHIKEVIFHGPEVTVELIQQLQEDASRHVRTKFYELNTEKRIKKYIYVASDGYWDLLNNHAVRKLDTLFLKANEKERLLDYLRDFVHESTQQDYERFNIPYKCNILLYGKPGTGKTSTILAMASELRCNIGLIPISRCLDDTKLIHAMNSIKKYDCKMLVLEDIDCLFMDRKENDTLKNSLTLSGLLNCMDGLFRNDGIMVFLTANNIDRIDEAMLRSSRMDFTLRFDHADMDQARRCFEFYFPNQPDECRKVMEALEYKPFTIAMLQQFFFRHRKSLRISEHLHDLEGILAGPNSQDPEKACTHLYS